MTRENFTNCGSKYYDDCDFIKPEFSSLKKYNCAMFHKKCLPEAFDWVEELKHVQDIDNHDRDYHTQTRKEEEVWRNWARSMHKNLPPLKRRGSQEHSEEHALSTTAGVVIAIAVILFVCVVLSIYVWNDMQSVSQEPRN